MCVVDVCVCGGCVGICVWEMFVCVCVSKALSCKLSRGPTLPDKPCKQHSQRAIIQSACPHPGKSLSSEFVVSELDCTVLCCTAGCANGVLLITSFFLLSDLLSIHI